MPEGPHWVPMATKLRIPVRLERGSDPAGDKLRRGEGYSPDRRIRSPSVC